MNRTTIAALAALVVLVVAIILVGAVDVDQGHKAPGGPLPKPSPTLQEDDPGWDCHTMGNRTCGPEPDHRAHRRTGG